MSKIQFYEEIYNRYLRKISHEYKSFFEKSDRFNFNEGNHSYSIKKPSQFYYLIRIVVLIVICIWFYVDIFTDIFMLTYYASKSKWSQMVSIYYIIHMYLFSGFYLFFFNYEIDAHHAVPCVAYTH